LQKYSYGVGELADGLRTKRLRKLRPTLQLATSAKAWGENPGNRAETERPRDK